MNSVAVNESTKLKGDLKVLSSSRVKVWVWFEFGFEFGLVWLSANSSPTEEEHNGYRESQSYK